MLQFFQLLQILTAIAHSVQSAESMLPASSGADKLKAATDCVVAKVDAAGSMIPQVQSAISAVVSIANASGLFKKS